jgi:hypothetical protein
MLLRKLRPNQGIRFAWLPVWTDEGEVWLEWVHYRWNATEFGSYSYWRWVPEKRYTQGERAFAPPPGLHVEIDKEGRRFFGYEAVSYATPPDISKCGKLRDDGPTPCHYPHCTCMNVGGSTCGEPRCVT